MPLFSSKQPHTNLDDVLETIRMGECSDHTIRQLQELLLEMSDDDVKSLADTLMTNLVKYPDDIEVLTGSVKALEALPFMPKAKNEFIITLLLSLLKTPINKKDALQRKSLKSEVIKFLLYFVSEDDQYVKLMMPELIAALDDAHGAISSNVFHVLEGLAMEKPEYFERYSASLIKQLGSISRQARAESAKLIGIIAKTHPEYVGNALPFLQSLASFYPDANVKRNANEAYQIIWRSMKKDITSPVRVQDPGMAEGDKGFAGVVKTSEHASGATNPELQFTDAELKDIIELTKKEFKSDAEAILDSLGVGHLTVKGKDTRARHKPPQPKAVSPETARSAPARSAEHQGKTAETAKQATDFATTLRSGHNKPPAGGANVVKPEIRKPPQVKAVSPETARSAPARSAEHQGKTAEKQATDFATTLRTGHNKPPAGTPSKGPENVGQPAKARTDPRAGRTFKCPKCGRSVWAEGQLCNSCRAEELESLVKVYSDTTPKIGPNNPGQPVKARADPAAGRTFKCPKCGRNVWAKGQLCNSCAAEEFEKPVKGHYDVG